VTMLIYISIAQLSQCSLYFFLNYFFVLNNYVRLFIIVPFTIISENFWLKIYDYVIYFIIIFLYTFLNVDAFCACALCCRFACYKTTTADDALWGKLLCRTKKDNHCERGRQCVQILCRPV
jgi:hypothetical protein